MSFSIRMDGQVIASIDEQATAIRLMSARGETAVTGLGPDDAVVDIIVDRVAPGGPPRLDQVEAKAMQELRDRGQEGIVVGNPPIDSLIPTRAQRGNQGLHTETLRAGGVDKEETQSVIHSHPLRDLTTGLDVGDEATRTARLTAFAKHGDEERAIRDNPPNSGSAASPNSDDKKISLSGSGAKK